jgi:hypothetical protein
MLAPDIAQYPAAVRLGDLDQRAEGIEGRRDIAGLLGDDDEVIVVPVIGKRDPETIEDSPAQRRHEPQVHAVLVGEYRITVGVQNLQLVHAPAKRGNKRRLAHREDCGATGKEPMALRFPLHRRFDNPRSRPRLSAPAHQPTLGPAQQKTRGRE